MCLRSSAMPRTTVDHVCPPLCVTKRPPLLPTAQPVCASRNVASAIVLELLIVERGYQPSAAARAGGANTVSGRVHATRAKTKMQRIHETVHVNGNTPFKPQLSSASVVCASG